MMNKQQSILLLLSVSAPMAAAQRAEEELSFGEWLLQHIIVLLGLTVLFLVFLWCCCSIHAGRAEKRAQELRR